MDLSSIEEDVSLYANFWRRFGAFWVDFLVLLPVAVIGYFVGERSRMFHVYWLVPGLALGLWFHVYLVRRYGGTPGKLLLNVRIAMVDGSAVTTKAAALRHSIQLVLGTLTSIALAMGALAMTDSEYFSLGAFARSARLVASAPPWYRIVNWLLQVWIWGEFVTMLFNRKRRAVHDFIAGTVVLRSDSSAERVEPPVRTGVALGAGVALESERHMTSSDSSLA